MVYCNSSDTSTFGSEIGEIKAVEYNPFVQKCNDLRNELASKKDKKALLDNELIWFNGISVEGLLSSLKQERESKQKYNTLISAVGKEISMLNEKINKAKKHTKTIFNPFNWFDKEQISYRNKLNGLKKELSKKNADKDKILKSLATTDGFINKISLDIEKHKNFDEKKVNDEVNRLLREVTLLEEKLEENLKKFNSVDAALQPVMKQIERYKTSISTAKEKISKAESFERKLDSAENSYERAMIHKECEDSFGDGSPQKTIMKEERTIRQCERDLEKTRKHATQIANKASREIRKIIIDGNNLCYEAGKFVGLEPLLKITSELLNKYQVVVVFDAAIRAQVKANDNKIRTYFSSDIEIHVVATKQLADETILDIASNDDICYILSNDRFGEFRDKEVVNRNRLIRHEIVSGKVIIHDLNINLKYR